MLTPAQPRPFCECTSMSTGQRAPTAWMRRQWVSANLARGLCGTSGSVGEVDADEQVEVFRQEVLEFAAFYDPESVVAGCESLGFWADPRRGDEHSGCCPFSSTDPASARTSLVGTHLL